MQRSKYMAAMAALCVVSLALGLVVVLTPTAFAASSIYVRPGGDDTNCDGTVDVDYAIGLTACAVQTIQKGVDLVDAGGTVYVAAGTYNENIVVDKRLSLLGAGSSSSGTVITQDSAGAGDSKVGVVQVTGSGLSSSEPLLLQDLRIEPVGIAGISVGRFTEATGVSVDYLQLDNVHVIGTNTNPCTEQERGLYVDLTSSLTNLVVTDSAFDNLHYGWYVQKQVSADTSTVQYVNVEDTTFNHNNTKGIYAEKLSDAAFTNVTVSQNGYDGSLLGACSNFTPWMSGVDVNLKAGTYQNLTFTASTITNNGLGGAKEGVGLTTKARDDASSYNTYPATLDGVTLQNNVITGNERGVRFGEPGKDNAGPTNVVVFGNNISGNVQTYTGTDGSAYGDIVNQTASGNMVDASGNWLGSNDPATVAGVVSGEVDYTPWLDSGTDTDGGAAGFQGDFSTLWVDDDSPQTGTTTRIQEGVDLVSGSTVYLAPGTYNESVVVNKVMTLDGAGSGSNPAVDSILQGTSGIGLALTSGADATHRVIARDLRATGYDTGINVSSYNTLENVASVANNTYGVTLNTLTDLVITGSQFNGNKVGIKIASSASADQVAISNSEFNSNTEHGWYSDKGSSSSSSITNLTVTDTTFNGNVNKGIYTEKLSDALFTRVTVDSSGVGGPTNHRAGIDLNLKYGSYQNIKFVDSVIVNSGKGDPNGGGILIKARRDGSYASNPATLTNVELIGMVIQNNGEAASMYAAGVRIGESNNGSTPDNSGLTNVSVNYSLITGNLPYGVRVVTTNPVDTTCDWWEAESGPTITANPGGLGQALEASSATFSPWLIYDSDASTDLGFQTPTAFTVAAGGDISEADNDYRRLANAIGCVQAGQTVTLSGTFDWSDPYAVAAWAMGYDTVAGGDTLDDYWILAPTVDDVTLTAASLGSATIQGPGDEPSVDLEGALGWYASTGTYNNWTVSNLQIYDFDVAIGMYYAGSSDQFDGTTITSNHIRVAEDLPGGTTSSDPEAYQNIGIHYAFGSDQTISNNTIDLPGDGESDPGADSTNWWLYSSTVGMQSNTSGGSVYDGLQIVGNTVRVLNAQSAYPERIRGIWENAHGHTSNITVSDNTFTNLAAGNDPALNLQQAFRVTSHSGASTTVTYANNSVDGANVGFWWLDVSTGLSPVQMTGNTVNNTHIGFHVRNNGVVNITGGDIFNNDTGVLVEDAAVATINNNDIVGNATYGVNNTTGASINAENNFWGSCDGPGPVGPGSGDPVSTDVDFDPWVGSGGTAPTGMLQAMVDAASPYDVIQLGICVYDGATVDKPLTIQGVPGTVVTEGSAGFTVTAPDVTLQDMLIDGDPSGTTPSAFPGVLLQAGADNLVVQNTEITDWADGVQVASSVASFKLVANWIHDNADTGLQIDPGVTLSGIVTIEGNLFKDNDGNGVQHDGVGTLDATYNSWGDVDGPTDTGDDGDGVGGLVTYDPWTFSEVHLDMDPATAGDQTQRSVSESESFDVAVMVDAENLYGVTFKLSFDDAKLTYNGATLVAPWAGRCSVLSGLAGDEIGYRCNLLSAPEWDGGQVAILSFTAEDQGGLGGDGPWTALLDVAHDEADTSTAAIGGVKVFVNNAGYNDPSVPERDITDANDGQVNITGIAQYTGYVDLQGRANDSGAALDVFNLAAKGSAAKLASGTSAAGGAYTTAYVLPHLLNVGTTYYLVVDRALYLPTTAVTAMDYVHSKLLSTRPLTTLGTLVLLGGDATDDDLIDIGDASCIGGDYLQTPGPCGSVGNSDVNGDGLVDILDLTLMGGNFYKTSSPWTP